MTGKCLYCQLAANECTKHLQLIESNRAKLAALLKKTEDPDGCWPLDLSRHTNKFRVGSDRIKVGRYCYLLHLGYIPEKSIVRHRPSNDANQTICGNPSHYGLSQFSGRNPRPCPVCTLISCTKHQQAKERKWWQEILDQVDGLNGRCLKPVDFTFCWPCGRSQEDWIPTGMEEKGERIRDMDLQQLTYWLFHHRWADKEEESRECDNPICVNPLHMRDGRKEGLGWEWFNANYPELSPLINMI
jgi:hypothetical protein